MNALETICWIHDELRQAFDQVICEGVDLERIRVGQVGLIEQVGVEVDGHHVFRLMLNNRVRVPGVLDRKGLPVYEVVPITRWEDRWRDYVKLLTVRRAIGARSTAMSNGELRMRYNEGLGIDANLGSDYGWLEFEHHRPGVAPFTGADGTIHEFQGGPPDGRFIVWRKVKQEPLRMRLDWVD